MPQAEINIAIDGYSSTGKSTLARQLAAKIGYTYVDTGAMYRGVTLYALRHGLLEDPSPKEAIEKALPNIELRFKYNPATQTADLWLNGENVETEIRTQAVAKKVSPVAAISKVRAHLVAQQRAMAQTKGVVMDGRDIGTVVLPGAQLKIFMTARQAVRVKRRYAELQDKGQNVAIEEVQKNLAYRDNLDSTREDSPLKQAKDALVLDTSDIGIEAQLEIATGWVKSIIGG